MSSATETMPATEASRAPAEMPAAEVPGVTLTPKAVENAGVVSAVLTLQMPVGPAMPWLLKPATNRSVPFHAMALRLVPMNWALEATPVLVQSTVPRWVMLTCALSAAASDKSAIEARSMG